MEAMSESGGMDLAIEAPARCSFACGVAADADLAAAIMLELARAAVTGAEPAPRPHAFPIRPQPQLALAL